MTPNNENTDQNEVPESFTELRSPYRPYPIGCKRELRKIVEEVIFCEDNHWKAYVSEVPPDEFLTEWELEIIRTDEPAEIWETDNGKVIKIYSDRVERDGIEASIGVGEAKTAAREQGHFNRIE